MLIILLASVYYQAEQVYRNQRDLVNELATDKVLLEKEIAGKDYECVEKATEIILERNRYRRVLGIFASSSSGG